MNIKGTPLRALSSVGRAPPLRRVSMVRVHQGSPIEIKLLLVDILS